METPANILSLKFKLICNFPVCQLSL